ncbi:MAG: hypothetical protein QNJ57_11465 [Flavobacteriaceae bacterium]|nr:hypothetical protein [Flavobacteriaceae bacterium]
MRKVLLVLSMVFLLVSFTNIDDQKIILKDIDGTLLQSYAVIDNEQNTITFTVDANTTVSSSVIDGEFKIFLVENGNSNETATYTLNVEGNGSLSFDSYFEAGFDVASADDLFTAFAAKKGNKPRFTKE